MENQTNEIKVGKENIESTVKKIGFDCLFWLTQNGLL